MEPQNPSIAEEFSVRLPLFRVWMVLSATGVLTGLVLDLSRGLSLAVVLDSLALSVLVAGFLLVLAGRISFTQMVALTIYNGSLNFVVASLAAAADHRPLAAVSVYQNLYILALILAAGTYLVGRSAAVVMGIGLLGLLGAVAVIWQDPSVDQNLWFVIPATAGTCFLLFRYRTALDRLIEDLRKVIRENKALRDRERLAALGELGAGIAHELKNPLNLVVNFAQSSKELLADLEASLNLPAPDADAMAERAMLLAELVRNMEDIRSQGLRGVSIVRTMMHQARAEDGLFHPVDLFEVAGESLQLAWLGTQGTPGTGLVLHRITGSKGRMMVLGVRGDLSRALVNLCANAFASVGEKAAQGRVPGYRPEVVVSVEPTGTEVRVTVADNGLGFGPGVADRLFTPYFTTKPPDRGTGMGLKLVREVIVDQHKGQIKAEGDQKTGARFIVILPAAGQDSPANPPPGTRP